MSLYNKNKVPSLLIDGLALLPPRTGIGRYAYEISSRLLDEFEVEFYYGYFSRHLIDMNSHVPLQKARKLLGRFSWAKKMVRLGIDLPRVIIPKSYDVYWHPSFIPSRKIKARHVVTSVHDFSILLYPDFHPKERVVFFKRHFFSAIKHANVIITPSNYTKQEIVERLGWNPQRVHVIYHGVDHGCFRPLAKGAYALELPEKYILSVGSIEPRKNLMSLLKAYDRLPYALKEEYHLVLAGFSGWQNREIMAMIQKNRSYIHYLGFLSEEELVEVYNRATLFAYLSFYEGFGLPPLEAMACGTPVLLSHSASLPEVGGDAVLYCDPYDIDQIKESIEQLLENEALRLEMVQKGLLRAQMFDWQKSAEAHKHLLKGC